MRRYPSSLIVAFVFAAMVAIAWTPSAEGQTNGDDGCLEFCQEQAICQCAKIQGGGLRHTECNMINSECVAEDSETRRCECEVTPLCKSSEKGVVLQAYPPADPIRACACVICPCKFFAMPLTTACWPEAPGFKPTFNSDSDSCEIRAEDDAENIRNIPFLSRGGDGVAGCGNNAKGLPDCPTITFTTGLTDAQVTACRACLEAYATALNDTPDITVTGGPPYMCAGP